MKKKLLIFSIAFLYCTALFLLTPFSGGAFSIITATGSVLYGVLLPFFSCGSWIFALLLGAIFMEGLAVGWMLSPELYRVPGILFAMLMLAAAFFLLSVRGNGGLRFEREHLPRKIAGSILLLAAQIFVFFIWSCHRPEGLMSMEMDNYHFNFILFYYPTFSLLYGAALPFFFGDDRGFSVSAACLFILICAAGLQISGVVIPAMTVIYGGIMGVGTVIGQILKAIISHIREERS